jgi:radical SAM-linked protein
MALDKSRIRFRKDGDLRLVSHHDLMRAWERMLRRAGLPFRSTEGFHPQPRMVFAQSLPLGIIGSNEVVEMEWTESVEPPEAVDRLSDKAPAGLTLLHARRINMKQSARPRRAVYRLPVPALDMAAIADRCAQALGANELWVDRERPRPRQVNIRPYVKSLQCVANYLEMDLWVTPEGSARADELAHLLGLNHLLDQGAVLERSTLELWDEVEASSIEPAPDLPDRESRTRNERPLVRRPAEPEPAGAHWGASPNGPMVE